MRRADTLPLDAFEDAVRRVFAAPSKSIYANEETGAGLARAEA